MATDPQTPTPEPFLYPPAVMIASLEQERVGYVSRLDGGDKAMAARVKAVDEQLAIHRARAKDATAE